jgi:monomeric sarcosine oxidase
LKKTFDFVVVGAGVFGVWIACSLRRSGASVLLVDAYGPGNSRASSGGETRIIRAGYGPDELYTRFAVRSFRMWREFLTEKKLDLFFPTGVLWLGREGDAHLEGMYRLLNQTGVSNKRYSGEEIARRYPQLRFNDVTLGVLEEESGVMLARRAVQQVQRDLQNCGVEFVCGEVISPNGDGKLAEIAMSDGQRASAGTYVFACGPWLPKLFPRLLMGKVFSTRQEVFFFGTPAGNDAFSISRMPTWLHHSHPDRPYVLPDIENRGLRIALDTHGPEFDPDTGDRTAGPESIKKVRDYIADHIPSLANAPIVESRVCQYENTWNGDFLIDRHPDFENVWLAGGGSGHGFKHGPAVGEYLAGRILANAAEEPRFSLASKRTRQARAIF